MAEHRLKTWPKYFAALADGSKTFEVRHNDRNFKVGDVLVLFEWRLGRESGRELRFRVTYMMDARGWVGQDALHPGWVVMAIKLEPAEGGEGGEG